MKDKKRGYKDRKGGRYNLKNREGENKWKKISWNNVYCRKSSQDAQKLKQNKIIKKRKGIKKIMTSQMKVDRMYIMPMVKNIPSYCD